MTSKERRHIADNWIKVGDSAQEAAHQLYREGNVRGTLNRAYYSAYAFLSAALVQEPAVSFRTPQGESGRRDGPQHAHLPDMIRNHLKRRLGPDTRSQIRRATIGLYLARLDADYKPRVPVSMKMAERALQELLFIERTMKRNYE